MILILFLPLDNFEAKPPCGTKPLLKTQNSFSKWPNVFSHMTKLEKINGVTPVYIKCFVFYIHVILRV